MASQPAKSEYSRGKHPNSRENLIHQGRPSGKAIYGEPKKRRTLTITESGWQGLANAAKASGFNSVSEYLEQVGRNPVIYSS